MLNHWIRSLSARLWITSLAALAVSLTVLAVIVIYAFTHFPEQMSGQEDEHAAAVASGLSFDTSGHPVSVKLPERAAWIFDALPTQVKYRVLDAHGDVLLFSGDAWTGEEWIPGELADAAGKSERETIDGKPFDVVTLRVPHGKDVFYVQVATSERLIELSSSAKVSPVPLAVLIMMILAMIIFALTLPLTMHRVLRPLREASKAAVSITPRNLQTRLSLAGVPSEIAPLINAFNGALDRLENGFTVQQQFLAAAAHELQTPLTLLRGEIELQPEIRNKETLFREIDLMARHVRQLLQLAEVSESQNFSFGDVNCVAVVQDVAEYLERKADSRQVRLEVDARVTPPSIRADQSALFILLKNIVENAINVSPPHGVVSLIINDESIEVRDQGPGIRKEDLPHLFQRFWRARDAKHAGAGLGLAICNEIAMAHEWRLTVDSGAMGTQFFVWL
jgi:signal transduction histidine kinase